MAPSAQQTQATGVAAEPAANTVVTVRYWAAARAAAGVDADLHAGATVGEVVDAAVAAHPALVRVAAVATFLLDGRAATREAPVEAGATVEVLPPFAGG
ncbi:MoaD/ThiS family protein [Intrasporangium mesophilum]